MLIELPFLFGDDGQVPRGSQGNRKTRPLPADLTRHAQPSVTLATSPPPMSSTGKTLEIVTAFCCIRSLSFILLSSETCLPRRYRGIKQPEGIHRPITRSFGAQLMKAALANKVSG
jgi:hypothetical protein